MLLVYLVRNTYYIMLRVKIYHFLINIMNHKYYFPVKGEYRNQYANAEIAENLGIPKENIILKQNGDVTLIIKGNLVLLMRHIPVDEY